MYPLQIFGGDLPGRIDFFGAVGRHSQRGKQLLTWIKYHLLNCKALKAGLENEVFHTTVNNTEKISLPTGFFLSLKRNKNCIKSLGSFTTLGTSWCPRIFSNSPPPWVPRVTVNSAAGNTSSCTLLGTLMELAKVIFGGYRFFWGYKICWDQIWLTK